MNDRSALMFAVTLTAIAMAPRTTQGQYIYWTNGSAGPLTGILRANLDGSDMEATALPLPTTADHGIAVDEKGEWVYWSDLNQQRIRRGRVDGSDVQDVIAGVGRCWSLALDVYEQRLYGVDTLSPRVWSVRTDGTGFREESDGLGYPQDVALDLVRRKVYWTDHLAGWIQRVDFGGGPIENVIFVGQFAPISLAVDFIDAKIYWTAASPPRISRANLDGSDFEELVVGGNNLRKLVLDVDAGKMYWSDYFLAPDEGRIMRANLDGTGAQIVVEGTRPYHLAFDLTCRLPGDGNGDSAVNLPDFGRLQRCFTGPVGPVTPFAYPPECRCLNFDDDGDIDLADYAAFLKLSPVGP